MASTWWLIFRLWRLLPLLASVGSQTLQPLFSVYMWWIYRVYNIKIHNRMMIWPWFGTAHEDPCQWRQGVYRHAIPSLVTFAPPSQKICHKWQVQCQTNYFCWCCHFYLCLLPNGRVVWISMVIPSKRSWCDRSPENFNYPGQKICVTSTGALFIFSDNNDGNQQGYLLW